MKLTIFNVNLQQGFLMDNDTIIGAFSRHNKIIYLKHPLNSLGFDLILPKEIEDFEIKERITDNFSINMWTDNGDKSI